jgi:zinc transport system permease protein
MPSGESGVGVEPSLSVFFHSWGFFRDPVLAGSLVGAVLGLLGVYIVSRRMVFLSAALSQVAGFGVALALSAEANWGPVAVLASPSATTLAVTLLTAALLSIGRGDGGTRRDSWLGFAFLIGAAGSLALATRIGSGSHDIEAILFGSAVAVLPADFRLVLFVSVLLLLLHGWWRRGFVQVSVDAEGARVRGLPVRLLEVTLLVSVALAISLFTPILGALPVFAFTVLPAMAALRVSLSVPMSLLVAALIGAVSGFAGYVFAFLYDLPVGASQALTAAGLVLAAELARVSTGLFQR